STRWWSCSTIGPSGPTVRELRSLTAGMPAWVVEPVPWSDTDARSLLGWASAGGRRRAAGAASERRALPAVAAQAAEQDVGDGDVHVVGVAGVQAWGRTDGARDVLDATAPRAHDVVVVVASLQLVRARLPGQVEPGHRPGGQQVGHHEVDGLEADLGQLVPQRGDDVVDGGVPVDGQRPQRRDPLPRHPQTRAPEQAGGLLRGQDGGDGHAATVARFLIYSKQMSGCGSRGMLPWHQRLPSRTGRARAREPARRPWR